MFFVHLQKNKSLGTTFFAHKEKLSSVKHFALILHLCTQREAILSQALCIDSADDIYRFIEGCADSINIYLEPDQNIQVRQSLTRVLQLKEGVMVLNSADCANSTTITDNLSFAGVKKFIKDNDDDLCNRIKPRLSKLLNMPVLPSFSATSSLIMNSIDTTPTNVFATPLISGPASDYSAIYTGLIRADGITIWSCGESVKAIISLDLDLHEKIYLLVNSNSEIRDKYILCLG